MIKLFEEYSNEEYYWEITIDEFGELIYPIAFITDNKPATFTNEETYKILSYFPKWVAWRYDYNLSKITIFPETKNTIGIYKLHDEYYLINKQNIIPHTYKCDQMEGLIKWIEDFIG